jgi:hypothetical protein
MSVELLDVAIRVGLVIATTILFAFVCLAYMRVRSRKLLLISMGFGVFFVHALATLPELFSIYGYVIDENTHLLIHLVALVFILLGTLKD